MSAKIIIPMAFSQNLLEIPMAYPPAHITTRITTIHGPSQKQIIYTPSNQPVEGRDLSPAWILNQIPDQTLSLTRLRGSQVVTGSGILLTWTMSRNEVGRSPHLALTLSLPFP